jgi:triosephosphate isomerase
MNVVLRTPAKIGADTMKEPIIVLNMKTYTEINQGGALRLATMCKQVADETGIEFVVCPQQVDLGLMCNNVDLPVFAQHIDNVSTGSTTGWVTPEAVKSAGAVGTLINHSEHRIGIADISDLITRCRKLNLSSLVCTNDISVSRACAVLKPDFIAVEPPELIGGDISVTTADPEIVRRTVDSIRKIAPEVRVLTGAGVKNGEDVAMAVELGTCGVLLASGVVKSKDPLKTLYDLVSKI